jgi:hypothetical protein
MPNRQALHADLPTRVAIRPIAAFRHIKRDICAWANVVLAIRKSSTIRDIARSPGKKHGKRPTAD